MAKLEEYVTNTEGSVKKSAREESLLDKAKAVKVTGRRGHEFTHDEKELGLAWANDEVITVQVMKAMGHKQISVTNNFLAKIMKELYKSRWQK